MMMQTLFESRKGQVLENILTGDSFVRFLIVLSQSFTHPEDSVVMISSVVRLTSQLPAITS